MATMATYHMITMVNMFSLNPVCLGGVPEIGILVVMDGKDPPVAQAYLVSRVAV